MNKGIEAEVRLCVYIVMKQFFRKIKLARVSRIDWKKNSYSEK